MTDDEIAEAIEDTESWFLYCIANAREAEARNAPSAAERNKAEAAGHAAILTALKGILADRMALAKFSK